MGRFLLILCLVLSMAPQASLARTWYIKPDGTGDAPTIQAGIDSAIAGDTVLVALGTYHEAAKPTRHGPSMLVMKPGIALVGEAGSNSTILDAQGEGRVILCDSLQTVPLITGLTLTGGVAISEYPNNRGAGLYCHHSLIEVTDCRFLGGVSSWAGGGMSCYGASSVVIDRCLFSGNSASSGGGIHCIAGPSAEITNCEFDGNSGSAGGGGMYCGSCGPVVAGCVFSANSTEGYGGAVACDWTSSPTITHCILSGNTASIGGGAVYNYDSASIISHCLFVRNEACWGGGLACHGSWPAPPTIEYCTFWENAASDSGGGVGLSESSPLISNTIVAESLGGGAVYCYDVTSDPTLMCCNEWGNGGGDWVGCLYGQFGVNGNFSEDPLFCDHTTDDFTLEECSPCVDGYGCGQVGAFGMGCPCGGVSTETTTWGAIKSMYR